MWDRDRGFHHRRDDQKFHPAQRRRSPANRKWKFGRQVREPVAVRYGWADYSGREHV